MRPLFRSALIPAIAMAALALGSCASVGPWTVNRNELGDPATHVLVYGYLGNHGLLVKSALQEARFIQMDPHKSPGIHMAIRPHGDSGLFFLTPLPTGTSWKLYDFTSVSSQRKIRWLQGLSSKNPYDPRLENPGLRYLGSFAQTFREAKDDSGQAYTEWGIFPVDDKDYELAALKALAYQFRGSAWEPLISARIEELRK